METSKNQIDKLTKISEVQMNRGQRTPAFAEDHTARATPPMYRGVLKSTELVTSSPSSRSRVKTQGGRYKVYATAESRRCPLTANLNDNRSSDSTRYEPCSSDDEECPDQCRLSVVVATIQAKTGRSTRLRCVQERMSKVGTPDTGNT